MTGPFGSGWSWPLLLWGASVGPLWVAATVVIYRLTARRVLGVVPPSSRFRVPYPVWAAAGVPFGAFSAALASPVPDLVVTAYAVLSTLLPVAFIPRLRRRAGESSCASDGACGTCQVACLRGQGPAAAGMS